MEDGFDTEGFLETPSLSPNGRRSGDQGGSGKRTEGRAKQVMPDSSLSRIKPLGIGPELYFTKVFFSTGSVVGLPMNTGCYPHVFLLTKR